MRNFLYSRGSCCSSPLGGLLAILTAISLATMILHRLAVPYLFTGKYRTIVSSSQHPPARAVQESRPDT